MTTRTPRVLRHHVKRWNSSRYVYVGRPTKWGNPFVLCDKKDPAARERAIAAYREWLVLQPELVAEARRELRGKDLGCWCAPLPCYADVLLEVANS